MVQQRAGAVDKLAIKLADPDLAVLLVGAGFTNPQKIRNATDRALLAVRGIGQAKLDKIRAKFPAV